MLRLASAHGELRLISRLTSFATATDVTLAELHLEAFLPADDATARMLRERSDQRGPNAQGYLPADLVVATSHT